jgi:hypothetical protein
MTASFASGKFVVHAQNMLDFDDDKTMTVKRFSLSSGMKNVVFN